MKPLKLLPLLLTFLLTITAIITPTNAQRLPWLSSPGISAKDSDFTISLKNTETQTGKIQLHLFTLSENYNETLETEDYTITLTGEQGKKYINYTAQRKKKNYYCESKLNAKIYQITFKALSVFDTPENNKVKLKVQYWECKNADPLNAYFTPTEVQYWSTTWNLTLHTTEKVTINEQLLQYWTHKFNIHQVVNSWDNMIVITMRPNNKDRLEDIECTAYNLTIPKNALTSTETQVKNTTDIIWEFRVTNCPTKPKNTDTTWTGTTTEDTTATGSTTPTYKSTIQEGNLYLSILDIDENWKKYINISNLIYLLGIISFFLILFFVLFWFIKNSFLWNSKKSYR